MNHTFNKREYKEFINGDFHKNEYDEDFKYIKEIFESCCSWDCKITGLNHLLSVVLEQFAKRDFDTNSIIEFIYSLPDRSNFEIQETTERFIDLLFRNIVDSNLNLEEHLIRAQDKM